MLSKLGVSGAQMQKAFKALPKAMTFTVPAGAAPLIAKIPGVTYITPDRPMQKKLDLTRATTGASLAFQSGFTGQGIGVAVIDSGVSNHPDLAGRVVYREDFVGTGAKDFYGHGTHVAGIVAGSGASSSGQHRGIAPGANIIDLRVLDANRAGMESSVIAAIDRGKSTVALAVMRLVEVRGGRIRGRILFDGRDLMALDHAGLRRIRGREIGLVLQSPVTALNPALKLETQLREIWRAHSAEPWREARESVVDLLARMGLPAAGAEFLRRHPRELSVGQAQRVAIAMAVMHHPQLLIADEPTSALDPESRGGILDLFESLNRDLNISILYVSHDIPSVDHLCHRVIELTPAPVSVF